MSAEIAISKDELPQKYRDLELKPTSHGVSQSVYFLGGSLILKIFERSQKEILEEVALHQVLERYSLRVPKVLDRFQLREFEALVFEQIPGESPDSPTRKQLDEVCRFLDELHRVPFHLTRESFSNQKIKELVAKSRDSRFIEIFGELKVKIRNDTLIHGDLFMDNVKFREGRLLGVFDFSDASMGDSRFDFAVVALSWCKSVTWSKRECLLRVFEWVDCQLLEFLDFIGYATLFYGVNREIDGREYQDLLSFYQELKETKRW